MRSILFVLTFTLITLVCEAQKIKVPEVYSDIKSSNKEGQILTHDKERFYEFERSPQHTFASISNMPKGTKKGFEFDFLNDSLSGTLYFGLIPYGDSKHPLPVYFKKPVSITNGMAEINMDLLRGKYDMIGWEESEFGVLGYRVADSTGLILYDGRVAFTGNGPFKVEPTIIDGPYVTQLTNTEVTIAYRTHVDCQSAVYLSDLRHRRDGYTTRHEIYFSGLDPDTEYTYQIRIGDATYDYDFRSGPDSDSTTAFTFAYASDSRKAMGGGERNVYGTNYYIMRKLMALAYQQEAGFVQFTGDMIDGYCTDPDEIRLQYANWKRAVEPFGHHMAINAGMGNHEALMRGFDLGDGKLALIDRYPFDKESAEALFAEAFTNPMNGPRSEDGSRYDPSSKTMDFPTYRENVYHYKYGNVAVIVLNSDYWYAPSLGNSTPWIDGNLHGYIMDNQMDWLKTTLEMYEADETVKHIFVTQHTPAFPNGGHVHDDMWYNGSNEPRPNINGSPVKEGIIERRDQYLDLLVNQSTKVRAILTGDEHNYARTIVGPETPIYPKKYKGKKIKLERTILQINNGAAGAPYYAQEETPWTPFVSGFTTQNALVLFDVDNEKISVRVINPDTLEEFDSFDLYEPIAEEKEEAEEQKEESEEVK